MSRRAALLAIGLAAAAAVAALLVSRPALRSTPGEALWRRAVLGSPGGRVRGEAVLLLPGTRRGASRTLTLALVPDAGPRPGVVLAEAGRPVQVLRPGPDGRALVVLPPAAAPGVRVRLRPAPGSDALRIAWLELSPEPLTPLPLLLGGLVGFASLLLAARLPALAAPLSCWLAGLVALSAAPLLLWWSLPAPGALGRLVPVAALLGGGVVFGRSCPGFGRAALLLAALVFGAWVRVFFLPAPGGWDADYWKAIAAHASEHGFTRVYGGPDAVPPGHFWSQLQGREPIFTVSGFGRDFVVDQPPGIQMLWAGSWALVRSADVLPRGEAQNLAAKLPATLGDALAVAVLLWCFRREPARGLTLAALYWALPISWLSSAVLGYFDGAQAPLAVAALVAAGRGQPRLCGAALALAALLKATALIVAPAAALALWLARASIPRALAAGLALVALALLPFALDGTLATAVVHVYRILFQERLSGGFANLWWLVSHVLSLGIDGRTAADAIPFVRIEALGVPARPLGVALFAAVAGWALWLQRRAAGARAAALCAATLLLGYAMLAIGVHENHPHGLYLALLATGVATWRLAGATALLFLTGVLNALALSGLGRYYGLRYAGIEPLLIWFDGLRLAPGFDLTLALALVNLSVFAFWLVALPGQMRRLAGADAAGGGPA